MALASLLTPRVCELGKIKIGGLGQEKQSARGGTYRTPRKDDHFTITTLVRTQRGDLVSDDTLMKSLQQKYGDADGKLRRLPIYLLSNDIENAMQSAYVYYQGKRCVARADGDSIEWFFDRQTRKWVDQPIVEEFDQAVVDKTDEKGNRLFKLHTTFNCVIGAQEGRWGGVYKFRTTSRITADQLYGSLLHIQSLTNGQLAGIPLMLVVRPMQVSPNGQISTVHVVHVEIMGSDMLQIQQRAKEAARLRFRNATEIRQIEAQHKKMLALPGGEAPEEVQAIVAEFAPEHVEADGNADAPIAADPLLDDADQPQNTQPNGAQDAGPTTSSDDAPIQDEPATDTESAPSQVDDGAGQADEQLPENPDATPAADADPTNEQLGTWPGFKLLMESEGDRQNIDAAALTKLLNVLPTSGNDVKATRVNKAIEARRKVFVAFRAKKLDLATGKIQQ